MDRDDACNGVLQHSSTISLATKELLNRHNIRLNKSLGQNLLMDHAVLLRIIDTADLSSDDTVIEIGTGTGLLAKELAKRSGKVITYEIDRKIVNAARDYLKDDANVEIRNEDFLKADLESMVTGLSPRLKIVANVPYCITTPIIEKIISAAAGTGPGSHHIKPVVFSKVILTVQREFAERMVAKPGTKDYGSFSLFVNYYVKPQIISFVPRSSFLPQPDVGSAIISMEFLEKPPAEVRDEKIFFDVIRSAFGQRRKMLRNALLSKFNKDAVDHALSEAEIDPRRRGETLSIEEFSRVSNSIKF